MTTTDIKPTLIPGTADSPPLKEHFNKYLKLLEDTALSDVQKTDLITALYSIVTAFIDIGFGLHPVQQAQDAAGHKSCGKLATKGDKDGQLALFYTHPKELKQRTASDAAKEES